MEISLITAFLGGVLALLSPCGALLLPAFFASTLGTRLRLLAHGGIFYLGLALTLVPLGLGLGALGTLLVAQRDLLILGTAVILVVLGLAQSLGFGFDVSKHLPGAGELQRQAQSRSGILKTLLLGATSGVAGFCAGPILGAILTLAMAQGNTINAGIMLAAYGLGMVVPLVGLAAIWSRLSPRAVGALRGRGFQVFGLQLHTTSVLTGLLIVGLGILFWTTNGLISGPSLVPAGAQRWLQSSSSVLASPLWDALVIITVASVAVTMLIRGRARARDRSGEEPEA